MDMEVMNMTRLMKMLVISGLASVSLMQVPCTFANHGFSIIPNGLIPNPLAGFINGITGT